MNESYRLRYTNQIVGIFLLIFLLFLFVISVLVFRVNFFVQPKTYFVDVAEEEIADLYTGADVMILGEHAGEVVDIRYVPDSDRVRIELAIDRDRSDQISEDSVVELDRKFGVGAPILTIRRDQDAVVPSAVTENERLLPFRQEDDRINQLSREVGLVTESIQKIQQKMDPTLGSVGDAAGKFEETLADSADPAFEKSIEAYDSFLTSNEVLRPEVLETTKAMRTATENLESRIAELTTQINMLVQQDMKETLQEVRDSTNQLDQAAKSVEKTSDNVDQDVAVTLKEMREAISEVSTLAKETRQVVKIMRSEANELPGSTGRMADTVSEAEDLVDEINDSWLLQRLGNRSGERRQVSPSSVRGGSGR